MKVITNYRGERVEIPENIAKYVEQEQPTKKLQRDWVGIAVTAFGFSVVAAAVGTMVYAILSQLWKPL